MRMFVLREGWVCLSNVDSLIERGEEEVESQIYRDLFTRPVHESALFVATSFVIWPIWKGET